MKRILILVLLVLPFFSDAQSKPKKYQGLLWEITGNGSKKPSYLFGTMHVSSKLAFHLADSFYLGIKNADMVALETNPESWQEDMSNYDKANGNSSQLNFGLEYYTPSPEDYFTINTLKFYKYEKKIERALYSNPSTINNLLYRSYGNQLADFEEDTYLDMYIYQCGKKWGKKVAGVEKYAESMKLMMEAYKDAAKDKNRKERSYDVEDNYSSNKLQDAYKAGNLDWLDSINRYNSFSSAFDEKFLYRRNEIQASSIDSILKSGRSLFVGVGAAHLPGERGVIEILRKLGYRLRSVKMGARDSQHKNQVEQLRVPVVFSTQTAEDGLYKVDIPGKFYKSVGGNGNDQYQYADMANGSYFMVTRVMTNAWVWNQTQEGVDKAIDSLLYENIPGRIISKTSILKNGYKGIDLVNRTRRGDIQHYMIFTTPFEVIIFKMSGVGDYVLKGDEARRFFGSIKLKEYKSTIAGLPTRWKKYSPAYGGFSVDFPYAPFISNDGSLIFDAEDISTQTQYRVMRSDIHNYGFVEEDSFDLRLMEESFSGSDFIDKNVSRKLFTYKGFPALDCVYKGKDGDVFMVRFLINGPHYYTVFAHGKREIGSMNNFLNSFEIKPYIYPIAIEKKDTSLFYSVKSTFFPEIVKSKWDMPNANDLVDEQDDNEGAVDGMYRSKIIANDTTGEKIMVRYLRASQYLMAEDSNKTRLENVFDYLSNRDTTWIVKMKKSYQTPDKWKVRERIVTDTGSSRALWTKIMSRRGITFELDTQLSTIDSPSTFLRSFYDSFKPEDTLQGIDIFSKKTGLFFDNFMSTDSAKRKSAIKNLSGITLESADLPLLKKAVSSLNWKEKKYLETKKSLIGKLENMESNASSDYLKEIYAAAGDTLDLQYIALETLAKQKTKYSYNTLRDILISEPPVLDGNDGVSSDGGFYSGYALEGRRRVYQDGNFMDDLHDSLGLTKSILPGLIPLLNLEDYKYVMMSILGDMLDSGIVKPKDYEAFFQKFLLEAKQELKKQTVSRKQKAIRDAEQNKNNLTNSYSEANDEETSNSGQLQLYAKLLLPVEKDISGVQQLFSQMMASDNKPLKYDLLLMLMESGHSYPDTLLNYFASQEQYRYQLYNDLKEANLLTKFPPAWNNHLALAKSRLMSKNRNNKPDSLDYLDRRETEVKGRKGFIYFFKYKSKKDDMTWRIASVGLIPLDSNRFNFDKEKANLRYGSPYAAYLREVEYDFTDLGNNKLSEEEPVAEQLDKELKRLIYSKRKSGKGFYNNNSNGIGLENFNLRGSEEHD